MRLGTAQAFVTLEFPSVAAGEAIYYGATYRALKSIRDKCSSARLVFVEGSVGRHLILGLSGVCGPTSDPAWSKM
jgi:hypothetical protein